MSQITSHQKQNVFEGWNKGERHAYESRIAREGGVLRGWQRDEAALMEALLLLGEELKYT